MIKSLKKYICFILMITVLAGCGDMSDSTNKDDIQDNKELSSEIDEKSNVMKNDKSTIRTEDTPVLVEQVIEPDENADPVMYEIEGGYSLPTIVHRCSKNGFVTLYGNEYIWEIPDIYNPNHLSDYGKGKLLVDSSKLYEFTLEHAIGMDDLWDREPWKDSEYTTEPIQIEFGDYAGYVFEEFDNSSTTMRFLFQHGDILFEYKCRFRLSSELKSGLESDWGMNVTRQMLLGLKFFDDNPELVEDCKMKMDMEQINRLATVVGRCISECEMNYKNSSEFIDSLIYYYILLESYGRDGVVLTDDLEFKVDADIMDMCARALFNGVSKYEFTESREWPTIRYDMNENVYYLGMGEAGEGQWFAEPSANLIMHPKSCEGEFQISIHDEYEEQDDISVLSIWLILEENTEEEAVKWGLPYKIIGCSQQGFKISL